VLTHNLPEVARAALHIKESEAAPVGDFALSLDVKYPFRHPRHYIIILHITIIHTASHHFLVPLFLSSAMSFTHQASSNNSLDCDYGSKCHAECELRHLDEFEQKLRGKTTGKANSKLVLCAGPERSGSTWLYNAVRHLNSTAGIPCDSYWIHRLQADKIQRRLAEGRIVVIKTHKYYSDYGDWLFKKYNPVVLLTHRDLREVLVSYMRVGWASDIPNEYVEHHMKWLEHQCHARSLDLSFKEIVNDPNSSLKKLAASLELKLDDDRINLVKNCVNSLKPSSEMKVDQVTKMWPSHISGGIRREKNDFDYLLKRFPHFYEAYDDL